MSGRASSWHKATFTLAGAASEAGGYGLPDIARHFIDERFEHSFLELNGIL